MVLYMRRAPTRRFSAVLVTCVLVFSFFSIFTTRATASTPSPHSPICILGNAAFTAAYGVTGGTGTASDPYIIAGWDINVSQSPWHGQYYNGPYPGIGISNTDAHFVVLNVNIHGLECTCDGAAAIDIDFINVTNAVVETSTLTSSNQAIYAWGSANLIFKENSLSNEQLPGVTASACVQISGSTNVVFSGNTFSQCPTGGLWVDSSSILVYHNNFLQGGIDGDLGSQDVWDNGYPSGGNYWSSYTGVDDCSGAQQNVCTGPDGIGDTPFTFKTWQSVVAQDRYPLMKPFSAQINDQPPTVTISSVSPNPANTGQLVTVSFTGSDIDGSISSIGVNWGDGTPTHNLAGTATSDTHSYTATGTFTIMIVATDNSGSTGQVTGSVTVNIPTAAPYALVVTAEGKVYRFYHNGTLTLVGQPVTTPLRQVAWKPDGSYALIVGDFATLVKYDGTSLATVPTGISTGFNFWSVSWKQDGSYALIGGSVGLLLKYDGVSVTQISNPGGTTILSMSWHPSGSYVVLSGKSGGLRTYDGSTIKSFATGTTNDLNTAAWNPNGQYALIGGLNGVVLKFDGTTVTSISTNGLTGTNAIKSIAFNPLGTLALLVGDNGMVLTYNGSTLTLLTQVTYSWLRAVSWSTYGTAYVLGGSGTVLTYANGTEAKLTTSPVTTSQFRGIAWKPQ